jgi:hypothetical protein
MRIILVITLLFLISDGKIYKLYTEKQPDAQFGWAVDIYGDFAVVGSLHYKTDFKNNSYKTGVVFVYKKNGKGKFVFLQKITPPDPSVARSFGAVISIYNHDLLIGASMEKPNVNSLHGGLETDKGAAYAYKYNTKTDKWVFVDKIIKEKRADYYRFGKEVAIYKNLGLITSIGKTASLNIIAKDTKGSWGIIKSHENGMRGLDHISLYENRIAFSKNYSKEFINKDFPNLKKVLVGELNEKGEILNLKKLVPNTKQKNLQFGDGSIKLYKNICLVRSHIESPKSEQNITIIMGEDSIKTVIKDNKPIANYGCSNHGFVHVFMETTDGSWIETQTLVSPDSNSCDFFGVSISAFDDYSIIGAMGDNFNIDGDRMPYMGAAFIYKIDFEKGLLTLVEKVEAPDKKWNKFGFSVAVHNRSFIIGSRLESYSDTIKNAGGAYLFTPAN